MLQWTLTASESDIVRVALLNYSRSLRTPTPPHLCRDVLELAAVDSERAAVAYLVDRLAADLDELAQRDRAPTPEAK